MTLPSSGQLSIDDIASEFGGTTPHEMSEYYRNGAFVTSNNTAVPTSGQISITDFYGAELEVPLQILGTEGFTFPTFNNGPLNANASVPSGTNSVLVLALIQTNSFVYSKFSGCTIDGSNAPEIGSVNSPNQEYTFDTAIYGQNVSSNFSLSLAITNQTRSYGAQAVLVYLNLPFLSISASDIDSVHTTSNQTLTIDNFENGVAVGIMTTVPFISNSLNGFDNVTARFTNDRGGRFGWEITPTNVTNASYTATGLQGDLGETFIVASFERSKFASA